MLALNIGDPSTFPFIDPPDGKSIRDGFEILKELGAIKHNERGQGFELTEQGRLMARMPIDPRISRMLLEAADENCLEEVAVIASALSIQDPREWPADRLEEARRTHGAFNHPASDFMTLLNLWDRYHETWSSFKTQGRMRKFCREHFLSYRRMREWVDLHGQIREILSEIGLLNRGAGKRVSDYRSLYDGIHRSILSGYLSHIAKKKEKNLYTAARGREVMLFPGSGLFNRGSEWVVAAEMVETTRLFARTAAHIESDWVEALAGDLCRRTYSDPHWERKRGEVVALEQVTLYGLPVVTARPVSYGPIDPAGASSIFIRQALVEGDMERPLPFLRHNLDLIAKVSTLEDKFRRRDLLADEETIANFYERRLGGVYDVRTLAKIIREKGSDDFLRMKEEDLMRYSPDDNDLGRYPDAIRLGKLKFRLKYRFEPSAADDGVTLQVPRRLVPLVPTRSADWLVPGLLREKVALLLKGLPKTYRKKLHPLAATVETVLREMPQGEGPLLSTLGDFLHRLRGLISHRRHEPRRPARSSKDAVRRSRQQRERNRRGKGHPVLKEDIGEEIETNAFEKPGPNGRRRTSPAGSTATSRGRHPSARKV
jgi:ATP-dependent helicase HrpA